MNFYMYVFALLKTLHINFVILKKGSLRHPLQVLEFLTISIFEYIIICKTDRGASFVVDDTSTEISLSKSNIKILTREIISRMGMTEQDAPRKRKPCRKLFIHTSKKSASNKRNNLPMEPSKLLCLNLISFS